jgi:UDP-glucuronate 4-epimerase
MHILLTGSAGFIGFHLTRRLLGDGHQVLGLDSLNDYYDTHLKYARLGNLGIDAAAAHYGTKVQSATSPRFHFVRLGLEDRPAMERLFGENAFDTVINLAAQPGVRYSLLNPHAYIESNIAGFLNILEGCRNSKGLRHLVYASSSSVYGISDKTPFSEGDSVDHPVSLYAATKKGNELMAHTYSHLFGIPTTGLRFFTVYGPWGRPDMAYFSFAKNILEGKPIPVFNQGQLQRDFTYIDDIVEGICRVLDRPPTANPDWDASHPDPASSRAPYRLYNIGNNSPVPLLEFISVLEEALGKKAILDFKPMQPGDVFTTFADISGLERDFGWKPATDIRTGIRQFVQWLMEYNGKV